MNRNPVAMEGVFPNYVARIAPDSMTFMEDGALQFDDRHGVAGLARALAHGRHSPKVSDLMQC